MLPVAYPRLIPRCVRLGGGTSVLAVIYCTTGHAFHTCNNRVAFSLRLQSCVVVQLTAAAVGEVPLDIVTARGDCPSSACSARVSCTIACSPENPLEAFARSFSNNSFCSYLELCIYSGCGGIELP